MQVALFHSGTLMAMLRFSYWVVAVGQVPSSGMAETGRLSPSWRIITAVTSLTNCGADAATVAGLRSLPEGAAGTVTSSMASLAASMASQFSFTTSSPFLP